MLSSLIFNTDQGCQCTDEDVTKVLSKNGISLSMDGKGRRRDNIVVERFWRSMKYEEISLHGYESPADARVGIGRYREFYNGRRPYTALGGQPPNALCLTTATPEIVDLLALIHV